MQLTQSWWIVGVCLLMAGSVHAQEAEPMPEAMPEPTPEERVERIIGNSEGAAKRIEDKDLGDETRKIQADILADIEALIKEAEQPPPPMPMSDDMPPMAGQSNGPPSPSPSPQQGGGADNEPQPEPMPNGSSPIRPRTGTEPMPMPMPGEGSPQASLGESGEPKSPARPNGILEEFDRGAWGHLPEKMRRDMETYYRDRFMPGYDDLLKEYYSSVAEAGRR